MKRAAWASLFCFLTLFGLVPVVLGQTTVAKTAAALPDCGPLAGQILHCTSFGFTYNVPFGWVDRTDQMQPTKSSQASRPQEKKEQTAKTLLAVFERPPEAPGTNINSAVIIAIEERSAYPQLKTAGEYFGPLSEVAEQRGLKITGNPYSFDVGTRKVVRADFVPTDEKTPIRQSSIVVLQKSYILSFTFLSGSDDDIDGLIENLRFTAGGKAGSRK